MNYNILGKSSLKISEIGFGCMSLGDDQNENEYLINRAIDSGVNFFDTADLYGKGQNEVQVGKILKDKRGLVKIASKVGNLWRSDGTGWDWKPSKKYILSAVEESLRRLQTEYLDLYQLHGGTLEDPIDEIIEAFELLVKQGKILYYGISSIRPNVIREYVSRSGIESVMMQYSLLDRRPEESCFPLLKEYNIGVLARGSVAQGLLVNKVPKAYLNYSVEEVEAAAKAIKSLSENGRSPAQTALRFVIQQDAISSAIVGIRTREQLEDALQLYDVPELTASEIAFLNDAVKQNLYEQHR